MEADRSLEVKGKLETEEALFQFRSKVRRTSVSLSKAVRQVEDISSQGGLSYSAQTLGECVRSTHF